MLKLSTYVLRHPLNADGRFAALGRLLRWQLASRLLNVPMALPFVESTFLFAERGMTGATGNWYCGLHEYEEMAFVLHFLRQEDVFMDVGANVGSYSVLAAGAVGARVISVEPIPATFRRLERNIVLNDLSDRVELNCVGLSSEDSELLFTADMDTVNHVMVEGETGAAIRVPVMRMDGMLSGKDVPTLIKIDVEGHELSVLAGGESTLSDRRVAAVVMEINGSGLRYGVSDEALLSAMEGYGFKPFSYDHQNRRLGERDARNGNAIFVRDANAVNERVRAAKRYRLINGSI